MELVLDSRRESCDYLAISGSSAVALKSNNTTHPEVDPSL